jgi:type IV secretory pathway VirB10-like protein
MANQKQDELDRKLDAALAKYAAVEPRTGLEERVLATLRAEHAHVSDRAWWRRGAIAAVVAVFLVTLALTWRSDKQPHPNRPVVTTQPPKERPIQTVSNAQSSGVRPVRPDAARKVAVPPSPPTLAIARPPKLDQFPSPQPLSVQEKILQSYVAENPEQAVLLARARTEALRQDQLEEMNSFQASAPETDSKERNNGTTER